MATKVNVLLNPIGREFGEKYVAETIKETKRFAPERETGSRCQLDQVNRLASTSAESVVHTHKRVHLSQQQQAFKIPRRRCVMAPRASTELSKTRQVSRGANKLNFNTDT